MNYVNDEDGIEVESLSFAHGVGTGFVIAILLAAVVALFRFLVG